MTKYLIVKYRKLSGSLEFRNVFKNFGFLSIIQVGNYLLPLLTLPYLVNILGPELFGHVMFAQAFIQYFIALVEYGFNFSATRDIALHKKNADKVSEIFWSVTALKAFLFLIALIILIILVFNIKKFWDYQAIYFLSFLSVIGYALFPSWFFQGLEQMKYITMVNLSSKIISTISVFVFIRKPEHFIYVPLIYAIASIAPSIISLFYLRRVYPLKRVTPTLQNLIIHLRNGWFIFLSSVSTSLYSVSNTFILGLLFNHTYAGYYSFAEKIIRACTSLFIPLNNALFPYMSLKMKESPRQGVKLFKKMLIILIFITALEVVFMYLGSDLLINIINADFYPSIELLKILSPLLMIVGISNLIGYQILITSGLERKYLLSVFLAGLLNLVLCITLSRIFTYKAAAISLLVSETFICFCFIFFSKKVLLKKA